MNKSFLLSAAVNVVIFETGVVLGLWEIDFWILEGLGLAISAAAKNVVLSVNRKKHGIKSPATTLRDSTVPFAEIRVPKLQSSEAGQSRECSCYCSERRA